MLRSSAARATRLAMWLWRPLLSVIPFFTALVAIAPAYATPSIFWVSDPVKPGETVLLTGADLGEVTRISIAPLDNTPDGETATASGEDAQIVQRSAQSVKFVVPASFRDGVFRFQLIAGGGDIGSTLNAPSIYWPQGRAAA